MSYVSLRGLSKRYGPVPAVSEISLEVIRGELLVLLGPSGSGKSTILKMVAGIEAADAGEIWLDGSRVDGLVPQVRDVAMVFQSYALYPHMSVAANLSFPLRSAGMSRAAAAPRVAEVAAMLGLDDLLDRRPGQLSGGQQQRVALGRAIVRRPKLFLMDEPLSNLDAKLRARTRLELSRLHERLGATTMYVTHDQVEAMTMGHRVAVIDSGRLRQIDRPEVVYEHPADLVVADFVGSPPMNCVAVSARRQGHEMVLTGSGLALRVSVEEMDPGLRSTFLADPTELVLGIRPEHVGLGGGLAAGDGLVERVELLGSERVVYVSLPDNAALLAARVAASSNPRPGERVPLSLPAHALRLFDPVTGASLGAQLPGCPIA